MKLVEFVHPDMLSEDGHHWLHEISNLCHRMSVSGIQMGFSDSFFIYEFTGYVTVHELLRFKKFPRNVFIKPLNDGVNCTALWFDFSLWLKKKEVKNV